MSRFAFFTGGIVSSLGKGIASASLGTMLKSRGYKVFLKKIDPYLNVDAGTMNPVQHGEVFVTEDGAECDLDLGHYERFVGISTSRLSNMTSGAAYQKLLDNERGGVYLGQTVQTIPHLTDLIQEFILKDHEKYDFIICEIGGTVGDIEGLPFLESIRQLSRSVGRHNVVFVHTGLCPYIDATQELKTKPMQHSVRALMSYGIEPDIILCRTKHHIPDAERKKLSLFCNVEVEDVIEAIDVDNVYKVPLVYAENGFDTRVLKKFGVKDDHQDQKYLSHWQRFVADACEVERQSNVLHLGIVGKYTKSSDAYKSLLEAIYHASIATMQKVKVDLISADLVANTPSVLEKLDGVVIPGGFGADNVLGKLAAIRFARINKVPMLGICFGMQLALVEFFRNVLGVEDATSAEFVDEAAKSKHVIIKPMEHWMHRDGDVVKRGLGEKLGGTMHLGAYECEVFEGTLMHSIYGKGFISERHRHRYNVAISDEEITTLGAHGAFFSARKKDDYIYEAFELTDSEQDVKKGHPFFLGVQFHPEFKSTPFNAHPIFIALLKASKRYKEVATKS